METTTESREQPPVRGTGWGGRRRGAGRRPRDIDRRGAEPGHGCGDSGAGGRAGHLVSPAPLTDDSIVLRAVAYLTDRRDGRAAQQINVTSLGVTVNSDDIAKARAIVRALVGPIPALPAHDVEPEGQTPNDGQRLPQYTRRR